MKLQRYHLLIIALICFIVVFVGINTKYDKFYRIQGMNNDNRILIETYLDHNAQEYLIHNNIPVDSFIRYIDIPGFNIENYEYYRKVEIANCLPGLGEIIAHSNRVVDKLKTESQGSINEMLDVLLNNDLLIDYENSDNFNFQYASIYSTLKPYYLKDNENYIDTINDLMTSLTKLGYESVESRKGILITLFKNYNSSQVTDIVDYSINEGSVCFVKNPTSLDALVNAKHYISSYVPHDLEVIESIPRLSYFTYLRSDAYTQLKVMFDDFMKYNKNESILVETAYESFDSLPTDLAGKSELQLGNTVSLKVEGISNEAFANTEFKKWLDVYAYQYGFVLRYPPSTDTNTGHVSISNLYRYVGTDIASKMHELNISTLEEYVEQVKEDV